MYENPDEYISEEKRRKQMLKKAIQYMEKKQGEDTDEMSPEEIVDAAEKFEDFVKKEK